MLFVKHKINKIFFTLIMADIVFASLLVYNIRTDSKWLVNIKYALFTDFTEDKAIFNASPTTLISTGFKIDSSIKIDKWKTIVIRNIPSIQDINQNLTEIYKAKTIVNRFIKNGADACSNSTNLLEKLLRMQEGGYGCCTDHSEAFLALASVFGLEAREVHTVGHVTAEFYDIRRNKWIWIDPLYAIMAKNARGEYLSLTELRDIYFRNEKIDYDFFGNDIDFNYNDPYQKTYYDNKDDFSDIMVRWGNNVFKEDEFNHKWNYLPKTVRQFVLIIAGIKPSYIKYVDSNTVGIGMQKRAKFSYIVTFTFLVFANILSPFYFLISALLSLKKSKR